MITKLAGKLEHRIRTAMPFRKRALANDDDSLFRPTIVMIAAIISFSLTAHFGILFALEQLLVQRATTTGADWARSIEARIPATIEKKILGDHITQNEFANLLNGILAVGNVYQIDFINTECHCDVRIGSYKEKLAGEHLDPAKPVSSRNRFDTNENTDHVASGEISNDREWLKNVQIGLGSHAGHRHLNNHENSKWQLPLERQFVKSIAGAGKNHIRIRYDHLENQPGTFAEVYHVVSDGSRISYMLRMLVDLEEDARVFKAVLYLGAASVLVLLMASFSYPMLIYLNAQKRRNSADERAHFLANFDVLTRVQNRNAFQEQVPEILRRCRADGRNAFLVLFDLNNFKEINDYYGHLAGDQVLVAFANLLRGRLPREGYVARLGGDEFVVVVPGTDDEFEPLEDIMDIPSSVRTSVDEDRQNVEAGICGGFVRYPRDGETLDELMRNADLALYSAKEESNINLLEYNRHMGIDFYENLDLRDEFRDALTNNRIEPYYQPLVNLAARRVEGFEALARWNHPKMGILTPISFGKLLDDPELGGLVGEQMLSKVLSDMREWKERGLSFGHVAINIGNGDLQRDGFALNVVTELVKNGLTCDQLAIEITENCLFGAYKEKFVQQLQDLRDAGCRIALDDFGTGYSSITQIKELPCTAVKIDKSFVNNVVNDEADQAIIRTLLELGRCIGFKVVAEGIETRMQLDFLEELGCEVAQGYYFSRPVPACEIPELLRRLNGGQPEKIEAPEETSQVA